MASGGPGGRRAAGRAPSSVIIVALIEQIIAETERRVLHGEAVATNEKIISLFEPHAEIHRRNGGRDVQDGQSRNLWTQAEAALIIDLVIEAGNPADSDRLLSPMLNRSIAVTA